MVVSRAGVWVWLYSALYVALFVNFTDPIALFLLSEKQALILVAQVDPDIVLPLLRILYSM
jgi:hypothetical protein